MHFDDRLGTVLRSRIGSEVIARIQYRQLIDLIGTTPPEFRSDAIDSAYQRLGELSQVIAPEKRARLLGEPGIRLRNPRLVAALAQGEENVARAAISLADLTENQWLDLAPALPLHARSLMRERRDLGPVIEAQMTRLGIRDRGLPPAESAAAETVVELTVEAPAVPHKAPDTGGIRAIVERIEKFRRARQATDAAQGDSPRLPLGDAANSNEPALPRTIDFRTDEAGTIAWASAALAPCVVGMRLAGYPVFAQALRRRQPLRGATILLEGAIPVAGDWWIDTMPQFDAASGGFQGFSGRFRRHAIAASQRAASAPMAAQGDRLRQMLHELRTPVNAIQGFAELIQQQLFGPTPHDYRALAAGIASDAARMLSGFEDLERLAKLETGAMEIEPGGCDLAAAIRDTGERLQPFLQARNAALSIELPDSPLDVALTRGDADQLAWRLLATLAASAGPGEKLRICARHSAGLIEFSCLLPAALGQWQGEELFAVAAQPQAQALSAGTFGPGFALRLSRAEIETAGGQMERRGDWLAFSLPECHADHSQKVRNLR